MSDLSPPSTWIIIPVHNRKATTLDCLRLLIDQGATDWARVLVVDDGSTDGTGEAVRGSLPEAVVLRGDGSLWWGGAMRLGMEHAWRGGAEHVFWLNDDCEPMPGTLAELLRVSRERHAITVAPCVLRETGEAHYGGSVRTLTGQRQVAAAAGQITPCEVMAGNCVCIPRAVMDKVGFIDSGAFPHVFGDGDYSLRAVEAGFEVLLVGDAICLSTYGSGKNRQSWLVGEATVRELWGQCFNPFYGPLSRTCLLFKIRYWGLLGLVGPARDFTRLVAVSLIRLVFPRGLIRAVAGRRSEAQARVEASRRLEEQTR